MGDMAEVFNDLNEVKKAKRKANTEGSTNYLKAVGIKFTSHNGGAHLRVEANSCLIEFWPSTGLWHVKNAEGRVTQKGRGVRPLVSKIKSLE